MVPAQGIHLIVDIGFGFNALFLAEENAVQRGGSTGLGRDLVVLVVGNLRDVGVLPQKSRRVIPRKFFISAQGSVLVVSHIITIGFFGR